MMTSAWNNNQLSRLMLGTVQFGLPYGVANRTGQPTYRDVLAILAAALEGGVNCFDTAAAYGTSEEVLGRALKELRGIDRVTIVTKVRPINAAESSDPNQVSNAIVQSIAESRQRLQLDCLPVVLFHREVDARYRNILEELRDRGWLNHIGVSCDNRPGPATRFVAEGCFSALQIPSNILDRRHLQSGVFQCAAEQGVAIFVRSVYLQGLVVMPENDIPPALQNVIPVRRRLTSLAGNAGMSLAELALRYMLSQNGVMSVIIGVETVTQVKDNLAMFNRGPLPKDLLTAIASETTELPESIITPIMWPPRGTA